MGNGENLSIKAKRSDSGKYWCIAENGLDETVNTSTYLDVQCKLFTALHCIPNFLRNCTLITMIVGEGDSLYCREICELNQTKGFILKACFQQTGNFTESLLQEERKIGRI